MENLRNISCGPLVECLASDGAIIVIEPGNKSNGVNLKGLRNSLINGHTLNLYSPCVDIWGEGRSYDCACFNPTRCYWSVPTIHRLLLMRGVKRSDRGNVPFHYAVLRKDAKRKYADSPSSRHFVKLRDLTGCDGQVVNIVAMVQKVFEEDKCIELHLCDGTNRTGVWSPEVRLFMPRERLRKIGLDVRFLAAERITLKKVHVCVERGIVLRPTDVTSVLVAQQLQKFRIQGTEHGSGILIREVPMDRTIGAR